MRNIKRIIIADRHQMGEHNMYQPLPNHQMNDLDPFLLLHHHGPHTFSPYNQGLPFGPHPHRGFETLTFIYSGEIEHADSQGFKSIISPDGVQWMTAGRGIVHSENIPETMRENGGEMEIIQLWMNLPKSHKMMPPQYQGLQKEDIPVEYSLDNLVKTQVISGEFKGSKGPANSITNLTVLNIKAAKGGVEHYEIPKDEEILFYVLNGELKVNGQLAIKNQMVLFDSNDTAIEIKADTNARFILLSGKANKEPIVAQGPFVMNTTTEIMQAMRDYQMGKMGLM